MTFGGNDRLLGANNSTIDDVNVTAEPQSPLPSAIPVLTPEKAIEVNNLALSFHQKTVSIASAVPIAVPILGPEEAIKANKEALRHIKYISAKKRIAKIFSSIGLTKNIISLFITLLPYLVFIGLIRTRNKKRNIQSESYCFSLQRRLYILFSVSLLFFGMMIFVPWSVYFGNATQFSFIFQDFASDFLLFFALCVFSASIVLLLIPPFISNYIVDIVAGIGFCVYLQSMFMNCFLGEMDGAQPKWNEHYFWGAINIIIWILITIAPFFIRKLFSSGRTITTVATGAIFILEIVATLSMVASASSSVWERKVEYVCDSSKQFVFSKKKNIILICLDQFGGGLVEPCFNADPDLKHALKDFTWYTDARGCYSLTFPALLHEMTGGYIQPARNQRIMFEESWNAPCVRSFFEQIKSAGYNSRIYVNDEDAIGPMYNFASFFSNIKHEDVTFSIEKKKLYDCLVHISGFSAMPFILKRFFFYDSQLSLDVVKTTVGSDPKIYVKPPVPNHLFLKKMTFQGILATEETPVISFNYTFGCHFPYHLDEKCQYHEKEFESIIPSARSCIYLLSEIVRLLKEANIYDQTAIIAFSDHGARVSEYTSANDISLLIKPFFANNEEVLIDNVKISSIDIIPTVLHFACGDEADFSKFEGYPASQIPSNRTRKVYYVIRLTDYPSFPMVDETTPIFRNCLREHVFTNDETFEGPQSLILKKSFVRIIPFNNSVPPPEIKQEVYREHEK